MAAGTPPDMRVFDRSVRDDHAMYDGCLVAVCEHSSNWTRSSIRNAPVTIDHFRADTQRRLAAGIAAAPELKGQDVSDKRLLLRHFAHRLTAVSGNYLHAMGETPAQVLVHIRTNLSLVTRYKKIVLQDPEHPLRGHHKVKYESLTTSEGPQNLAVLPATAEDAALAHFITGPNAHMDSQTEHTEALLRSWVPYLIDVDDTHITSPLRDLRKRLLGLLGKQPFLLPELRVKLLRVILEDWQTEYFSGDHEAEFRRIEDEVSAETGVAEIFNRPDEEILERCFRAQLAFPEISEDMAEKLLARKPALEHLVMQAADREDWVFLQRVADTFGAYFTKLKSPLADLGHLGLSMLTQDRNMEADRLRGALT